MTDKKTNFKVVAEGHLELAEILAFRAAAERNEEEICAKCVDNRSEISFCDCD